MLKEFGTLKHPTVPSPLADNLSLQHQVCGGGGAMVGSSTMCILWRCSCGVGLGRVDGRRTSRGGLRARVIVGHSCTLIQRILVVFKRCVTNF